MSHLLKNHNEAVRTADRLVRKYGTRNADHLAEALGLIVMPRAFKHQKGVYKVIERNRYIFIKQDLHPVMHNIVLLHEIGHDQLHRSAAIAAGGFQEFNLFNMADRAMEYEANMFAAQVALPDEEILEYIMRGCDVAQIGTADALGHQPCRAQDRRAQPAGPPLPSARAPLRLSEVRWPL